MDVSRETLCRNLIAFNIRDSEASLNAKIKMGRGTQLRYPGADLISRNYATLYVRFRGQHWSCYFWPGESKLMEKLRVMHKFASRLNKDHDAIQLLG